MLVNSVERGSSAWFIGDPRTHDPAMDAPCKAPAACRDSRTDDAHVVPTLHRTDMHVHETWKGQFARAHARTAVAWFETKFRIKFRIIFQNICITFPLCSREHASSILEFIDASALVAGRTFSLREGIRVHTVARSSTSVCVRCCDYPAGIRVSKGNSSKRLCSFQISTRYSSVNDCGRQPILLVLFNSSLFT